MSFWRARTLAANATARTTEDGSGACQVLLGLAFADVDAEAAASLIAARRSDAPFGYVVTPNADHLVRLARDPALTPIYHAAWLRLMDSRIVTATAHLLRLPAPKVAPGSDLTELLLCHHLYPGERITIVGLRKHYLPDLIRRCGLAPPAHYDPPMDFDRDPSIFQSVIDFILANPARLIFLAVGSPRQEKICAALAATGRATGTAMCIGASLDFLAGITPRAPRSIQKIGLEWLFRLMHDPRRLARRYLLDSPQVFTLLIGEALDQLRQNRAIARDARPAELVPADQDLAFAAVDLTTPAALLEEWRTRHDSNVRPSPSEGDALSS